MTRERLCPRACRRCPHPLNGTPATPLLLPATLTTHPGPAGACSSSTSNHQSTGRWQQAAALAWAARLPARAARRRQRRQRRAPAPAPSCHQRPPQPSRPLHHLLFCTAAAARHGPAAHNWADGRQVRDQLPLKCRLAARLRACRSTLPNHCACAAERSGPPCARWGGAGGLEQPQAGAAAAAGCPPARTERRAAPSGRSRARERASRGSGAIPRPRRPGQPGCRKIRAAAGRGPRASPQAPAPPAAPLGRVRRVCTRQRRGPRALRRGQQGSPASGRQRCSAASAGRCPPLPLRARRGPRCSLSCTRGELQCDQPA